jgi:hypothetical protein
MGPWRLARTAPASRCWEECWSDASIPDAIEASYRMACPCFAPRCIPRKSDPGILYKPASSAAHPARAYHPALSLHSHLYSPSPCPLSQATYDRSLSRRASPLLPVLCPIIINR